MARIGVSSLLTLQLAKADFSFVDPWTHPLRPSPDPPPCGQESGVACPVCVAPALGCAASAHRRVRRGWTTLSYAEKQKVIIAMHVMKWTGLGEGQAAYGNQFRNYDYFVHWHSAFINAPQGDIGHFGMQFILVHKALVLAFENSLLAIDPSIGAMPYWDQREHQGFLGPSPLQFGSAVGSGPDSSVRDGAFANWTVSRVDHELYASKGLAGIFAGNNFTGVPLMRNSNVSTASIARFPKCGDAGPPVFSEEDFAACTNTTRWVEWTWCIESPATNGIHPLAHSWLGSAAGEFGFQCGREPPRDPSVIVQGDLADGIAAPNDPAFFPLHAFVDMSHVEFQLAHPEGADTYWGYQAADSPLNGTNLLDVLSEAWPFVGADLLEGVGGAPQGALAAWEIACWLRPGAAPYTYDKVEDMHCHPETSAAGYARALALAALASVLFAILPEAV